MLRFKKGSFLFTLFFVSFLVIGSSFAKEPRYVLKMGTLAPEGSTWMSMWEVIAKFISKRTNGDIKFVTYSGGVMGDEPDMVRKLKLGQLHLGGFTVNGIKMIAPEMLVLELPFLFEDYGEVNYLRKKMLKRFNEFFVKRGFVLLAWIDQGFIKMYTKNRVETLDELKAQKLWVWGGELVAIETFKAWGINPIPTAVPEALSSLQAGLINAIYTSPLACVALQWYTQIKYVIDIDIRYEPAIVVELKSVYDSLPSEYNALVEEAMELYLMDFIREIQQANVRALTGMYEQGIQLVKWKESEVQRLRELSKKVWYSLADNLYPRSLLDEILKYLDEYRKNKKRGVKQ